MIKYGRFLKYEKQNENSFCALKYIIPNGIKLIGAYAFGNVKEVTSVELSKDILSIRDGAFKYCQRLESVSLPDKLEHIGKYAFSSCYNLKSVVIPKNVKNIGEYAFYECRNLEDVIIDANKLVHLAPDAFYRCNKLSKESCLQILKANPNCFKYLNLYRFDYDEKFVEAVEITVLEGMKKRPVSKADFQLVENVATWEKKLIEKENFKNY